MILSFNGCNFTAIEAPADDRSATALFKVWGIGSKLFAVGALGLILEFDADTRTWSQVPTAVGEDMIALWGTSEDNIVAVGGRAFGQIAHYDGTSWTTMTPITKITVIASTSRISACPLSAPGPYAFILNITLLNRPARNPAARSPAWRPLQELTRWTAN